MELTPGAITAATIGVENRLQIFQLQRWINGYPEEPLLAVLPGVALQELRRIVGVAETALIGVSLMVVVTALLGMAAMILSGLNQRRREMATLRAVGARPLTIIGLLMLEATVMSAIGAVLGMVLLYLGLALAQRYIEAAFRLYLPIEAPSAREGLLTLVVILAGAATCLIPALRAYWLAKAEDSLRSSEIQKRVDLGGHHCADLLKAEKVRKPLALFAKSAPLATMKGLAGRRRAGCGGSNQAPARYRKGGAGLEGPALP